MRKLLSLLVLLLPLPAFATAYTVTSSHRTMHVGDQAPKCDVLVKNGSTVAGAGSAIWSVAPTCSIPTGSLGTAGTYTITVTPGTLVSGGDTAAYTNGTIVVAAADQIGANLVDAFVPNNGATAPPSGWFTSLPWAAMDITSNPVENCSTPASDNSACIQHLIASARGSQTTNVKCTGSPSTVTAQSGTSWTGMAPSDGPVNINGNWFTVSSYTDATHMILTGTATAAQCSTAQVTLYLPRTVVTTTSGSTTVTRVSGPTFTGVTVPNQQLQLGFQTGFKVASITDANHLVLQSAVLPNVTGNVPMYLSTLISGGGAGAMPVFLYTPPGQFKILHPLTTYGAYTKFWGAGQSSEWYVPPNTPDFQTVTNSILAVNPVNSNDTFDVHIQNMWFHIGVGNPHAIGLTYAPSNWGALRNVLISADDANCIEGLNLGKSFTGPGMMKNVAIYGCQFGISANQTSHSMTGEYFTIEGQTTSGVADVNIPIQLRKVLFDDSLAATNTGAQSNFVLMDSEIYAGSSALCVQNSTTSGFPPATIFLKNIQVHGSCTATLNDYGTGSLVATTGDIGSGGVWTGTAQTLFDSGSSPAPLNLTFPETPEASDPATSTWCALGSDITTWSGTVTGCAATTVYAPPAMYFGSGSASITVPDTVNHLQFYNAMDNPGQTWHLTLNVAGTSSTPLIIQGCPQAQCLINHTGSRTLVILDTKTQSYTSSVGAGTLFIDDSIMGQPTTVTINNANFYCRACNQEQSSGVKIQMTGGNMVIFGYKTEHNGPNVALSAGSHAEIYGGEFFGDPSPAGSNGTAVQSTDASFFMTLKATTQCAIPCNGGTGNQFLNWIQETRTNTTSLLAVPNATTTGSSQAMNMYYAFGAAAPPAMNPILFQGTVKFQGKVTFK